jgi:hypothetical protein
MLDKLKSYLSKDNTGLIIAIIGVIIQGFHTYFVAQQMSSIDHAIFTPIYACCVSIFVSSGLVFFSLRAGSTTNTVQKMKYESISLNFRWFETFINFYYTGRKLIYLPLTLDNKDWSQLNYFDIIAGFAFSIGIPYILSLYSGQINLQNDVTLKENEEFNIKIVKANRGKNEYRLKVMKDE